MEAFVTNQRGISLIEILVAMVIGSIGFLALATMQTTAMHGNTFSSTTTDATTLAQGQMEELMRLTYSALTTDTELVDTDGDGDAGLNDATAATADSSLLAQTQNNLNYDIFWNISDDSLISNTKTVNVIVAWTDPMNGQNRTVSVQGTKPRIN